jgi:hypothetical protein
LDYGADLADGLASLLLPCGAPRPPRLFGLLGQLESKKGFEKLLKRDFPHAPLPPPCPETPQGTDTEAGAEADSLTAGFSGSVGGGLGLGAHAGLGSSRGDGAGGGDSDGDDGSDGGGMEAGGGDPLSKTALKKQRKRDNLAAAAVAETPIATDSYGHRLLLKMGWKGDGHGLRQDGIASPVRPSANGVDGRPKRRGLTEREEEDEPDGTSDAGGKRLKRQRLDPTGPARQWRLTVDFPSAMAEQAVRRELEAVAGMQVLQAAPEGA